MQLIGMIAVAVGVAVFVVIALISMRGPPDRSDHGWRRLLPANDNDSAAANRERARRAPPGR